MKLIFEDVTVVIYSCVAKMLKSDHFPLGRGDAQKNEPFSVN